MPQIGPDLIVHKASPLNAEPPLARLRASFVTPVERFYIRTHGSIPEIDGESHRLRIEGRVAQPLELSLAELRERFPSRTVTATLQCAGNRRSELDAVAPVTGTKWEPGAIGTAAWTGVPLAELLRAAGCIGADGRALHAAFDSVDEVEKEARLFSYGASIPLEKALHPEVLVAWAMNGTPLAPEHGFPLRVVVPGYVGARSVKWLARIRVQAEPSDNYFQRRDYKLFPPDMDPRSVDWDAGTMLYELPVNAVICEPADDAELDAGPLAVRGYATSGERPVARVEVSADGGRTWTRAAFERPPDEPWSWVLWEAMLDLPAGRHELAVRAWDAAAETQPAEPEERWNFKGYVNNAWHRVRLCAR